MKILIIRNDRIGDLISTTLIISQLRHIFRNKSLSFDLICSNYGYIYASKIKGEISSIYVNDRSISPINDIKLIKKIRNNNYDLCLSLSPNNKSFLLNIASKAKIKCTIRILKKNGNSKPVRFLSRYFDLFMDVKNDRNYGDLTWSDFYSKLSKNIYKFIQKKEYSELHLLPSKYLKPKISYSLDKSIINKRIIVHIDEKWELSKIKIDNLAEIILKLSSNKRVLITSNYLKTKFNKDLDSKLGFKINENNSIAKSHITKNLILLNPVKKDNSNSYLNKLIQCVSLCNCVVQIHGGIGHFAGSFDRNIINLKTKNENLQKLYKIQTKGSYLDLYIKNSEEFKREIFTFTKKN